MPPVLPESLKNYISYGNWPESLKIYFKKCLAECQTVAERDQVQIVLKEKITTDAINGSLLTKDWNAEPVINMAAINGLKRALYNGSLLTKDNAEPAP